MHYSATYHKQHTILSRISVSVLTTCSIESKLDTLAFDDLYPHISIEAHCYAACTRQSVQTACLFYSLQLWPDSTAIGEDTSLVIYMCSTIAAISPWCSCKISSPVSNFFLVTNSFRHIYFRQLSSCSIESLAFWISDAADQHLVTCRIVQHACSHTM